MGSRCLQAVSFASAFWRGWLDEAALQFTNRGPYDPQVLWWNHSITKRPDYKSPWEANWQALQDEFALHGRTLDRQHQSSWVFARSPTSTLRHEVQQSKKTVHFASEVTIALCHDYVPAMAVLCVPDLALREWFHKPWALSPRYVAQWTPSTSITSSTSSTQQSRPQPPVVHFDQRGADDSDHDSFPGYDPYLEDSADEASDSDESSAEEDASDAEQGFDPFDEDPEEEPGAEDDEYTGGHMYALSTRYKFAYLNLRSDHNLHHQVEQIWQNTAPLEAVYRLQALVAGIDENDLVLIPKFTGDLRPGSPQKLVLVDIVPFEHGGDDRPPIHRQVRIFPMQADRTAVLFMADVLQYCRVENHRCQIRHNGEHWPLHERARRPINNGDYFEIELPPSQLFNEPTTLAVWAAEKRLNPQQLDEILQREQKRQALQPPSQSPHDGIVDHTVNEADAPPVPEGDPGLPGIPQATRDALPLHPPALRDLVNLWDEQSTPELEEEGPVAHIDTWYISHEHEPLGLQSRTLRLAGNPLNWLQDAMDLWHDFIDQAAAVLFHVVKPTPPINPLRAVCGHLILVQHPFPGRVAILFSHVPPSRQLTGLKHFAISIPEVRTRQDLLGHSYPYPSRRCLLDLSVCICRVHQMDINNDVALVIHNGDSVITLNEEAFEIPARPAPPDDLRVQPTANFVAVEEYHEFHHLFEQDEHGVYIFPQNYARLGTVWDQHARIQPGQQHRALRVCVWYLHHQLTAKSYYCRTLTLTSSWQQWMSSLHNVWADHIRPDQPWTFTVVDPVPFEPSSEHDGVHVIVWQGDNPHTQVALAAVKSTTSIRMMACVIAARTTTEMLLYYAEVGPPCQAVAELHDPCLVIHDRQALGILDILHVSDGFSWRVLLPLGTGAFAGSIPAPQDTGYDPTRPLRPARFEPPHYRQTSSSGSTRPAGAFSAASTTTQETLTIDLTEAMACFQWLDIAICFFLGMMFATLQLGFLSLPSGSNSRGGNLEVKFIRFGFIMMAPLRMA